MRAFGLELIVRKASPPVAASVTSNRAGGWFPWSREPFGGAFQRGVEWSVDTVTAHHAVFTCITLIASDIGKLRTRLMRRTEHGTWVEASSSAFSPVLRKPNRYQNHIQFKEAWLHSKLVRGNAYVFKVRDDRGVVRALYVLDASRVTPLVAPDGSVFYQLGSDNLSGITDSSVTVPASEIIHDRVNALFHPLVGVSPIFASGLAAHVGNTIETNAAAFFDNGSNPSGILTSPKTISQPTADRLKAHWESEYTGDKAGKVAVLGDGLTFEALRMTAVDAQMIEHLKWTSETVCSTFHVPAFKVGIGVMPTYQNAEVLNQIYYSDCLQSHIEQMELALEEGLGLSDPKDGTKFGVQLDVDALLRMDSATQIKTLGEGVKSAIYSPDEARGKVNLPPVKGGGTPYMQQQNYSLAALDARDRAAPAPSDDGGSATPPPTLPPTDDGDDVDVDMARAFLHARAASIRGAA